MNQTEITEMEWPSKRIPQGGLMHPRKVVYSPETHEMLKVIMDEAKLTMQMRKKLDWCLRSGSSLSDVTQRDDKHVTKDKPYVTIRPKTSRRRSYTTIMSSGDLERERYRPIKKAMDREVIKKRLQDLMEFGSEVEILTTKTFEKPKIKKTKKIPSKMDMFFDLLTQIQEREEWLKEMEELGEGEKHREVINLQIAERMRQIEALNISFEDEKKRKCETERMSSRSEYRAVVKNNHTTVSKNVTDEEIKTPKLLTDEELKRSKIFRSSDDAREPRNAPDSKKLPITGEFLRESDKKQDSLKKRDDKEIEKEFGELFKEKTFHLGAESKQNVKKESMRGFSIEGSSCLMSARLSESRAISPHTNVKGGNKSKLRVIK